MIDPTYLIVLAAICLALSILRASRSH